MRAPKYRGEHIRARAALLPLAIGTPCHFCGRLMLDGQALDLDHAPEGRGYRGMAHAACNRRDGARARIKRRKGGGSAIPAP